MSETFTPLPNNSAVNSKVSAVTPGYLKPPVSVIIPVKIHVPNSLFISIPKYSNIPIKIWQHAGATGFTKFMSPNILLLP